MLIAVRLRQKRVAAAIPGNLGSRRLPLLTGSHPRGTPKLNGVSTGRFLDLKGLHRARTDAPWAQNQHAASRREINFDFEVELC